jgi:hypothetical protein
MRDRTGIDLRHPNKPDLSLVYTIHYNAYKSVSRVFFATIYTHPDRREGEEDIPCQARTWSCCHGYLLPAVTRVRKNKNKQTRKNIKLFASRSYAFAYIDSDYEA